MELLTHSTIVAAATENSNAKLANAILLAAAGAIITGFVAIFNRALDSRRKDRDRRRDLYAQAYRDCLAWQEGYFRVRRRPSDGSTDRNLVERFHELQEALDFHEGWINSESLAMGRAFSRFKSDVKGDCEAPIRNGWKVAPVPPGGALPSDEVKPNSEISACRFQRDTRQHLSPWPWFRLCVWLRYRSDSSEQIKKEKGAGKK